MISEFLIMNGYGLYVWSAFGFTLSSFILLYIVIKNQYMKEREKFSAVWGPIDDKTKENEKDLIKECLCETVDLKNDLMKSN